MALDGALSRPNGIAYKLLVNVRLLHGALRLLLARSSALSSSAVEVDQEVPINQHDLAITLALFSYVSLRSLERLGIQIGEKERNAYFVMWQYAGRLLGIDEDVLPDSLRDQADFFFASQHSANPEEIPKSVLRTIDGVSEKMTSTPLGYLISRQDLNTFLEQLTVYLSGSDWVVGLGLKSLGESWLPLRVSRGAGWVLSTLTKMPILEDAIPFIHRIMIARNSRRTSPKVKVSSKL